jgi:hypothetical protein
MNYNNTSNTLSKENRTFDEKDKTNSDIKKRQPARWW